MGSLLKDGTKHLSGLEETVLKNADAVKKLSKITRTSMGPNGMHKMVVNSIDKLFVTSDSATIVRELDVVHPAARMVVMAAQRQEAECGDATNLVVVLSGELMTQAEALIRTGLHPNTVIEGYAKASKLALQLLSGGADGKFVAKEVADPRSVDDVVKCLRPVIAAKQYGYADVVTPLVARACIDVCPRDAARFNTDSVRVAKLIGAGVSDSTIIRGLVVPHDTEGTVRRVEAGKVCVFQGGLDLPRTETKGTVLVKNAQQLVDYSGSEEAQMDAAIQALADAGVRVVVAGSTVSELALHYCERHRILVVKVPSKFELRRLCDAVGASPLLKLGGAVPAARLGYCDEVAVEEIGSTLCTVFKQNSERGRISTIVVRASTKNVLEDVERAIDDGVNVYRQLCLDGRFVAGAGACEIERAHDLQRLAESEPGLEQYAIRKFAEALEVVPRTLAENAGANHTQIISDLYAAHEAGRTAVGVDIDNGAICDVVARDEPVLDHMLTKRQAIEYTANLVATILKVDQIIMQRPAGGPKVLNQTGAMDANDPDVA